MNNYYYCYYNNNNNYYCFHLMAIFPGEPGSAGSTSGPPPLTVLEQNLWGLLDSFTGQMSLLPPNHQHQGTEESTKNKP